MNQVTAGTARADACSDFQDFPGIAGSGKGQTGMDTGLGRFRWSPGRISAVARCVGAVRRERRQTAETDEAASSVQCCRDSLLGWGDARSGGPHLDATNHPERVMRGAAGKRTILSRRQTACTGERNP